MTVVVCEHVEDANPRHKGQCCKCGRVMPEPPMMVRDRDFEEQTLREAAGNLGLEHVADSLHAYADRRAHAGDIRLRDFITEAEEEIADLSSYCTWELQRMLISGEDDHEKSAGLWEALQYAVLTYAALKRARG